MTAYKHLPLVRKRQLEASKSGVVKGEGKELAGWGWGNLPSLEKARSGRRE